MEGNIRRVQREAAIQSGAVRRVGQRQRKEEEAGRFEAELAKKKGQEQEQSKQKDGDRSVSPPTDEDGGTRIDVVG